MDILVAAALAFVALIYAAGADPAPKSTDPMEDAAPGDEAEAPRSIDR